MFLQKITELTAVQEEDINIPESKQIWVFCIVCIDQAWMQGANRALTKANANHQLGAAQHKANYVN